MNVFGRIFLVLYSALLIAACAGLGVLVWNQDQKLDVEVRDFNLQAFITSGDTEKWLVTALLVLLGLLGMLTLVLAFQRAGPSRGALRMPQEGGGVVEVTATAIEALIRDELQRQPEIRQARPRVRLSGNAVDTDIGVAIEPSASIAQVTSLVNQVTSQVLREQVGVTNVRRPTVRISYDEISARPVHTGQRPQAVAPPPPPPPSAPQEPRHEEEPPAQ